MNYQVVAFQNGLVLVRYNPENSQFGDGYVLLSKVTLEQAQAKQAEVLEIEEK